MGGGEPREDVSRWATSSPVARVDFRARWAAASPFARRSQELSGGGCRPVPEPRPLSPRLIAGFNNSASAGPIGCTSGRCALEFGTLGFEAFDFGDCPGFFGWSGVFAISGIWDESGPRERAKAAACAPQARFGPVKSAFDRRSGSPKRGDDGGAWAQCVIADPDLTISR